MTIYIYIIVKLGPGYTFDFILALPMVSSTLDTQIQDFLLIYIYIYIYICLLHLRKGYNYHPNASDFKTNRVLHIDAQLLTPFAFWNMEAFNFPIPIIFLAYNN